MKRKRHMETIAASTEILRDWSRRIKVEALNMIHHSSGGHPGGSLSIADILAVLYFSEIKIRPDDPKWPNRDRVILSKGHACAALYAALGLRGFFNTAEFLKFRRIDGLLEGHPSIKIPGIDAPSGSLGMGLSQGLGMALGGRYAKKNFRVYVILGDGDMQEGATWEAIMAARHHGVNNLCAILDYNKIQAEGRIEETMDFAPVTEKLTAFKWAVKEIDGHDCEQIKNAFQNSHTQKDKPLFIIAHTIKGKGVSFMENQVRWHGTIPLSKDELCKALNDINAHYI